MNCIKMIFFPLQDLQENQCALRVWTDEAPSMIGRTAGTVTLLEGFLDRPLKYHCHIHKESQNEKN